MADDARYRQELAERLNIAVKNAGGTGAVSAASGIPLRTLGSYLSGASEPKTSALVKLSGACDTPLDWLASGVGAVTTNYDAFLEAVIRRVAMRISAGRGQLVEDHDHEWMHFPKVILDRIGVRPENALAIEAAGDSMAPNINDGDLTIVDTSATDVIEGRVYAFSIGDDAYVKRLRRGGRGKLFMVSDNRELYPEAEEIPPQEPFTIHGRVKWAGRQL